MNFTIIVTVASAIAGFLLAWNLQAHQITKQELTHANERITIQRAARQALERATSKITTAQVASTNRSVRVRADAGAAGTADVRVRDALAAAVRAAHSDLQTCTRQVTTVSELLTASTDLSRRIAAEADEWVNQAVTLQEAWPSN